jgi:hypothetical protein
MFHPQVDDLQPLNGIVHEIRPEASTAGAEVVGQFAVAALSERRLEFLHLPIQFGSVISLLY